MDYIISAILAATFLCYYYFNEKTRKKDLFIETFKNNNFPACIINSNNEVIWKNSSFTQHFPEVRLKESFHKLNPKKVLNQSVISKNKNEWILNNIELTEKFGITFTLSNKVPIKWWMDLPFPTAILSNDFKIKEVNYNFEDLVGSKVLNLHVSEFIKKFDSEQSAKEHGQELIWQTQKGIFPIKTWIKDFESDKIIFVENRLEFIKLKNKAQENQHLQILGQLASSIIHDFNNLLTCICGFTDSLEEKIPNDDSLSQIRRNVEQAAQLSKELLNFIKEKPVEEKFVEPKKVIPNIIAMLKKLLGSKIKVESNANTNGFIPISETQLEQIILNMAINSKDVMPNGGTFKINTYEQKLSRPYKIMESKTLKQGSYIAIEVSDTGTGISHENINKIFSPFFTTKTKGTGLGLASCIRIADHNGGGIKFTTSRAGTTFTIYLPLTDKEESVVEKKKKNKIIFVEDEETIRGLIKKSLEQENYDIRAFSNGNDALSEIENTDFDCLITDAILPGVDGVQLANKAKEKNPNIEVFLVSGYSFEDLSKNLNHKVNYISKPFTLKNLKKTLNDILSK